MTSAAFDSIVAEVHKLKKSVAPQTRSGEIAMPKPAKWGRTETIIWPPRSPIYTYGAIFLACIAAGLFVYLRFSFALTPLQQFYLPYYLKQKLLVSCARREVSASRRRRCAPAGSILPPTTMCNRAKHRRQPASRCPWN